MIITALTTPLRRLVLLGALCLPTLTQAESLQLDTGAMLRPVVSGTSWTLERLVLKAGSTLLVPAQVDTLRVDELVLERGAQLSLSPATGIFRIDAERAHFADGSRILGNGARGAVGVAGSAGVDLTLRVQQLQLDGVDIYLRGGPGGAGWNGVPGENGRQASCYGWRKSASGSDGGNGHPGASGGRGGNLLVQTRSAVDATRLRVVQEGGAGGDGGQGGAGGLSGDTRSCWVYQRAGSAPATDGLPGPQGPAGPSGKTDVRPL